MSSISFEKVKDYDEIDRSDPVARFEAREQRVRAQFVAVEEAKLKREALILCYRREGVNHMENCKELVKEYRASINEYGTSVPRFGGFQA